LSYGRNLRMVSLAWGRARTPVGRLAESQSGDGYVGCRRFAEPPKCRSQNYLRCRDSSQHSDFEVSSTTRP